MLALRAVALRPRMALVTATTLSHGALTKAVAPALARGIARAPTLGDVKPNASAQFNKKQAAFRDRLKKAADEKAIRDAEERQERIREDQKNIKQTWFARLIEGTPDGRQFDNDLEKSFSEVIARGKYVHSIVLHDVYPDKVDEYVDLVGNWYPRMSAMPEMNVNLAGSWRTEVGDCDTFVHIWEYHRYTGYHESLSAIRSHPDFSEFDAKLRKLIRSKHTSLMQEFAFWPTSPPRQLGGVFELRTYNIRPGSLLEWENHWRKGLAARRHVMEGVGAWFVQIGDLNVVHHMWQFADLEERKNRREKSWAQPGWGDTVHRTVPLIHKMQSRIMVPLPWSPIG